MHFKIDENLNRIAAEKGATPEAVAVELCDALINAWLIDDTNDHWGETVLIAAESHYVKDVCAVFAGFLYGNEKRPIPAELFDAFCRLIVMGDGDCPDCGGNLVCKEVRGHELKDGDYFTPNSWVADTYVYECPVCGKILKTNTEL